MPERQTTDTVLMIRPARFASNPQTAASNAFQQAAAVADPDAARQAAEQEFEGLVAALEQAGIDVLVWPDTAEPVKPDAIFPNNWLSTHGDGSVTLYPMEAENRRLERRHDLIENLSTRYGFNVRRVVDLSDAERRGEFLEGTGSLVLDRANRTAYACLSSRTHERTLARWAEQFGYETVSFAAVDENGRSIYHTNVMMSIGSRIAIVCLAAIASPAELERVRSKLADSGHEIVDVSFAQMRAFAGNVLELVNRTGEAVMVMSERARTALTAEQIHAIERHARIVAAPVNTIEDQSGGGVRCMLAEVFLPRQS